MSRVLDFGSSSSEDDIQRADTLANQALAAAPRSPIAHAAKAQILRIQRRCREAISEYEIVLALNRNWPGALAHIGRCKIYVGPIEEAIPILKQAIRLSPRDPSIGTFYFRIGEAYLLQSQIDEAIVWLERARDADGGISFFHPWLAAAYALKDEAGQAAAELAEGKRLSGNPNWAIAHMRAQSRYEAPSIRALADATFYAGMRKAGVPEE